MRFSLSIALLLLTMPLLLAQQPAASTEPMSANDYSKLFLELNKQYVDDPQDVAVLMDLAHFYADKNNPVRNLPLAMEYVTTAENIFVAYVNDGKHNSKLRKWLKRQINIQSIRNYKLVIKELARQQVYGDTQLSNAEVSRYYEAFHDDPSLGREARLQRVANAFQNASQQNTIEAYYEFVQTYPGTAEAEQAELAIDRIAPEAMKHLQTEAETDAFATKFEKSPAVWRKALAHKSKLAYANACTQHTIEAYRAFMTAYPSSEEYILALEQIDNLLQLRYDALSTTQDYVDFIKQNTDDDLAEQALEQLYTNIRKHKNIEAAKAFLENFPLDHRYNDVYRLFYEWHAAEGNLQPIRSFADNHKNYPFQMALNADLAEAESIDAFKMMRPYSENNKEEYTAFIRHHTGKRITFVALQRMLQVLRAKRDWKGMSDRMGSLLLSFEDAGSDDFLQLRATVETAPDPRTVPTAEFSASHDVRHPVLHPDGQHLYYTAVEHGVSRIRMVTLSTGKKKEHWTDPVDITFSNAESAGMTLFSFFDGGRQMLVGHDGDILIARREGGQWRIIENPPFPVNSDYIETDAYMLPDGTGMLLASDRPGGYNLQKSGAYYHGDTALASDIYFIPRTATGWGRAINLGNNVNTTYSERSPIMSCDQRTLYFISDGRGSLGYGDIWMTTRQGDGWTSWSAPINLGREANTCLAEMDLSFTPEEKSILYCSRRSDGRSEALRITSLHEATNSLYTLQLDASPLAGALSAIEVMDYLPQAYARELSFANVSSPISVDLYSGKSYLLLGNAPGRYVPVLFVDSKGAQRNLRMQGFTPDQLVKMLDPIDMPSVRFDPSTAQPTNLSMTEIERLVLFLKANPSLRIELQVNVQGNDRRRCYEQSTERAQNLRRFICGQGIDMKRIDVAPYGNTRFVQRGKNAPEVMIRFLYK